MTNYEKLELVHWAIQEAINGNMEELSDALEIIEQLREPYLKLRYVDNAYADATLTEVEEE
tara:strand:- start:315 stop:497 length:183 start_codon:yes stop_codon:yes gene_type:complete